MDTVSNKELIQAFMEQKIGELNHNDLQVIDAIEPAYKLLAEEVEKHSDLTLQEAKLKSLDWLLLDSFSFINALEKVYISSLRSSAETPSSERDQEITASKKAIDFTVKLGLFKKYQEFHRDKTPKTARD